MPSFHRYLGARIDARRVARAEAKDQLRDAVHAMLGHSSGGRESLTRDLEQLGARFPGASVDVLVFEPDYLCWQLWSLTGGRLQIDGVELLDGGTLVKFDDDSVCPSIDLGSEAEAERLAEALSSLVEDELAAEGSELQLPLNWSDVASVRTALGVLSPHVREPMRAGILIADEPWLVELAEGTVRLTRLVPSLADPERSELVEKLWGGGVLELGMEGVAELGVPDAQAPLTQGHEKARIAAIESIARRRSPAELPALLAALAAPENAGPQYTRVRQALYRSIAWFDRPEVRAALAHGLQTEPAEVRETIEYVHWRLS